MSLSCTLYVSGFDHIVVNVSHVRKQKKKVFFILVHLVEDLKTLLCVIEFEIDARKPEPFAYIPNATTTQ